MQTLGITALLIAVVGGLSTLFISGESDQLASEPTDAQAITHEAIAVEVENNDATLLDVRTAAEYQDGYISPAENYPLQLIQQGEMPDIALDEKIYLYCRSGNRSAQAEAILKEAGFSRVIDLGGLPDMLRIGGEITTD